MGSKVVLVSTCESDSSEELLEEQNKKLAAEVESHEKLGWSVVSASTCVKDVAIVTTLHLKNDEVSAQIDDNTSIDALEISVRGESCLASAGIRTVAQLSRISKAELLLINRMSARDADRIMQALVCYLVKKRMTATT